MFSKSYILINKYIKSHKNLEKMVVFMENQSPKPVMWIFYGMILMLALKKDKRVLICGIIPWADFFAVTKIRNFIDRKRPFEALGFEPIVSHSGGKSCPSRHASSSVIITMAVYFVSPFWGIITGIVSFFVCLSRVLTGVHYLTDVLAASAISIAIGKITFFGIFKKK